MHYVGFPQGLGIDERGMQEWFRRLEEHRGQDREHWIIKAEGEPIGEAYYRATDEYCGYRAPGMAEIDLKLAKGFWGRGYGSDALRTLAQYLFERGFAVLVVSPNLQNKAALRLYEQMGFEPQHRFWAEETKAEHEVWMLTKERFEP
jgi:RimJ/RimL family protein N-acetyltransferase